MGGGFLAFQSTTTAAVPEPASLALVGLGGLTVQAYARARRGRVAG